MLQRHLSEAAAASAGLDEDEIEEVLKCPPRSHQLTFVDDGWTGQLSEEGRYASTKTERLAK